MGAAGAIRHRALLSRHAADGAPNDLDAREGRIDLATTGRCASHRPPRRSRQIARLSAGIWTNRQNLCAEVLVKPLEFQTETLPPPR
jgi:hypothetical protein